jgi:hypothetical protein
MPTATPVKAILSPGMGFFLQQLKSENQTLLCFFFIRETRKLESAREKHFLERKIEGRKPDKDLSLRRLEFMPRNLD